MAIVSILFRHIKRESGAVLGNTNNSSDKVTFVIERPPSQKYGQGRTVLVKDVRVESDANDPFPSFHISLTTLGLRSWSQKAARRSSPDCVDELMLVAALHAWFGIGHLFSRYMLVTVFGEDFVPLALQL